MTLHREVPSGAGVNLISVDIALLRDVAGNVTATADDLRRAADLTAPAGSNAVPAPPGAIAVLAPLGANAAPATGNAAAVALARAGAEWTAFLTRLGEAVAGTALALRGVAGAYDEAHETAGAVVRAAGRFATGEGGRR
jgi:hypothetical protein